MKREFCNPGAGIDYGKKAMRERFSFKVFVDLHAIVSSSRLVFLEC